jgi:glutamate racemase
LKPVLVFDSGVGGLTVVAAIRAQMPDVAIRFVADDAWFPYGPRSDEEIVARVVTVVGDLVERFDPAAVVVACHTASTLVLTPLRARLSIPIVGTVPAIKPAAEQTRTGVIAVLATEGTIRRDFTKALIRAFAADCHVRLVGSANLASYAEAELAGEPVSDAAILAEIAPAFIETGKGRTDQIVLACTHYPLLLGRLERLAPWPVGWIDPAPAIARRLADVTGDRDLGSGEGLAMRTSGRPWPAPMAARLRSLGLTPGEGV